VRIVFFKTFRSRAGTVPPQADGATPKCFEKDNPSDQLSTPPSFLFFALAYDYVGARSYFS